MENTIHAFPPREEYTHTIIFLHGRDSMASEFANEFFESQASDSRTVPEIFPTIKWISPSSKLRMSKRFRTEMSQWFDMWSVENPSEKSEIQVEGLKESIEGILHIIRNEALLVSPGQIILGGISQGGATAMLAFLCGGVKLGGFVGLCSWLPFQEIIVNNAAEAPKNEVSQRIRSILAGTADQSEALQHQSNTLALETPIFLSHSKDDEVVPVGNGMELCGSLERLGLAVTWKCYEDGGHWVNEPQGVDDIVIFLRDKVGM